MAGWWLFHFGGSVCLCVWGGGGGGGPSVPFNFAVALPHAHARPTEIACEIPMRPVALSARQLEPKFACNKSKLLALRSSLRINMQVKLLDGFSNRLWGLKVRIHAQVQL
jgi:hypothetical protein